MALPIALLAFLAYDHINHHIQAYNQAKHDRLFIHVSLQLESFMAELQKERGLTEIYITAPSYPAYQQVLNQRQLTNDKVALFKNIAEKITNRKGALDSFSENNIILDKFYKASAKVNQLNKVRLGIDKLTYTNSFDYYSSVVTIIIDIIENIKIAQENSRQSLLTDSFTNLLWLIERSGQERGALNSLLTTDDMNMITIQHVMGYIAAQNEIIERLLATSIDEQKAALEVFLLSKEHLDIISIRETIQRDLARESTLKEIKGLVGFDGINNQIKDYLHSGDIKQLDNIRPKLAKLKTAVSQFEQHFSTTIQDEKAISLLKKLIVDFENTIAGKHTFSEQQINSLAPNMNLFQRNNIIAAMNTLHKGGIKLSHQQWWQLSTARLEAIRAINKATAHKMESNAAILEKNSISALALSIFTISLTLLISILLSSLILKRLVGELNNIVQFMTLNKDKRHFNKKLALTGNDEITEIERAYNALLDERKNTEHITRISAAVFEHASEAILISNGDNIIEEVNPAFSAITGYKAEEVIGQTPSLLKSGRHDNEFYHNMWSAIKNDGQWQGEIWNRRKNGEIYPELLAISVVRDEQHNIIQYICLFSDITKHKQYEQDIWHQANYDALTQLPNRSLMLNRLDHEIDIMQRSNNSLAVMLIDLDRFKYVNDTYGHSYGDELLVTIAEKLTNCLRKSDTVARLGGDEFIVLAPNVQDFIDIEHIAQNMLSAISTPITLSNNYQAIVSASIGITLYPNDAKNAESLLKNADTAMYRAKDMGKNTFCFYTQEMNNAVAQHMQLELDLRRAVAQQEFCLHYQPVLDVANNQVVGVEALVRWQHQDNGLIYPDNFIECAEDTGLIVDIGIQVLKQAAIDLKHIHSLGYNIHVAVNVSGRQCTANHAPIVDELSKVLSTFDISPDHFHIEITESMLMENSQQTKDILHAIKALGIKILMDDFGTGYSSLSYLKQFPIDTLKIDRNFIWKMLEDSSDKNLVKAIVMIGKSLQLELVAEGVETQEHLDHLADLGCHFAQGYHIAKPIPLDELLVFFKTHQVKKVTSFAH